MTRAVDIPEYDRPLVTALVMAKSPRLAFGRAAVHPHHGMGAVARVIVGDSSDDLEWLGAATTALGAQVIYVAIRHDLSWIAGPWLTVQAMAPRDRADVSTVFAISADPSFGVLVSFGLGGVATELLDDRVYRAVPLTDVDDADLISAPRAAPLLTGYRGTRVVAREPLIDLTLRSRHSRTISRKCPTCSCDRCSPGRGAAFAGTCSSLLSARCRRHAACLGQ